MIEKRFLKPNILDKKSRETISKIITDSLSNKEFIAFAYLHGSFTEGESFRDIDVAVFVSEHFKILELESDLSHELTGKTGYEVEVRVINDAPVAFQMAVLRKGKLLLSASEELRTDFIEVTGRRYREYAHFRNIIIG